MIEWFTTRIDALKFVFSDPWLATGFVLIAILLWWLNTRFYRRLFRRQQQAETLGWTASATQARQKGRVGFGGSDLLVMRAPRQNTKIAILTLLFFGGGAVFYALVVLPDPTEQTLKNWSVFAIMCGFSAMAVMLFLTSFNRVVLSDDEIIVKRLYWPRRRHYLSEITGAEFLGKSATAGMKLTFLDKKTLKLFASYEGFGDALQRMRNQHPDIQKIYMMGRMMTAAQRRR